MADDEEAGLVEREVSGDLFGAFEEELGNFGVVSDWFAVMDNFFSDARDGTGEFEFARDHSAGEVSFTNKIRNNKDGFAIHHMEDLAEAGFFFPEGAVDFAEGAEAAKRCGVVEGWCAGVGVLGGSVSDDDESGFGKRGHGMNGRGRRVWLRTGFGNRSGWGKNHSGLGLFSASEGRDG